MSRWCGSRIGPGYQILTYFIATRPYRGWQRSECRLLLHSFLSLDMFAAFSILRFGTFEKTVSWVGLTQFNRTLRTRRCSGMRRTCPSQLHLLSRAFITTFTVGFRASSSTVLPVIVASILDAVPLSLGLPSPSFSNDSQPYSRFDTTEVEKDVV